MNDLSPIVSEFESTEQASAHDTWLRDKVAASLADTRKPVPHDEAMKCAHTALEAKRDS